MTISRTVTALVGSDGRPLFTCRACRTPLSAVDLADLGLRVPDAGETADEYCHAELLDPRELRHAHCLERQVDDLP